MKKLKLLPVALMLLMAFLFPVGCNPTPEETGGDCNHNYVGGYCTICGEAESGNGEVDEEFSYYNKTKLRADKKIYAINMNGGLSEEELNTASAIQGLFARKEVTFYIDGRYMSNGVNTDQYYLNEAKENYGVTVENVTLEEAVNIYKQAWSDMVSAEIWGSKINLATGFKSGGVNAYTETSGAGYSTPGYIVYDSGTMSVNIASTLAGITGFIPVAESETAKYDALGLVEKMSVMYDSIFGYKWCFDSCITELSTDGLIHQNYALSGKTNYYVRDYGVMNKYFYAYYDDDTTINGTLKERIHSYIKKNVPIFGYTYSEDKDVALFSKYGQFIVPTDYSMNLSFHVADAFRKADGFTQPNSDMDKAAEQGKHYIAFVVSDGDNAQYWQNTAIFSTSYMGAARGKTNFPVTWSITPSLSDMMPLVMDAAYNSEYSTDYDYFCAPVSGQGYINAGEFYGTGNMPTFLNNLNIYLDRSGLNVTTILGADAGGQLNNMVLDGYANVENLKGGLVLTGNKYYGGKPGGVYWSNGKPFIVPRESLWSTQPAYLAGRINKYAQSTDGKDVTKIDAYTVINVHPWSHNYKDMSTIVGMLADNVEVVSVDRLVKMMTDNVTDKSGSWKQPALHGENTNLGAQDIPLNYYFNDFLLWAEDWTGGTWKNTDDASPEAYASFKTNLHIAAGATATKNAFTLPDEDDVWVTFYARAYSTNPSEKATLKMTFTVDGVTKTIIENTELKGVSGTGSTNVNGDGWQTFTFPISQYFSGYKGKQASVSVTASGTVPVRIDQFTVSARPLTAGPTTGDYYTNEFENGSTEDWLLGDVFETSQYHSWAAYSHKTNKPEGKLDVDASDGGGSEKRNANVNVWFAKNITLKGNDKLAIYVDGDADKAGRSALCKLSMYVDGKLIVINDWAESYKVGEKSYNLETLAGISLEGKEVTFVFEVRDSCKDDGAGQDFYLDYFRLTV